MNAAVAGVLQVRAAGELAHDALARSGGVLRPLPAFPDSPYWLAGTQIVWLGGAGGVWHPRRILLEDPRQAGVSSRLLVSLGGGEVWRCAPLPRIAPAQLAAACERIGRGIAGIGAAAGFGVLLFAGELRFPLAPALARVRALGQAVRADDAAAFEAAALPLLGLGPGLTPSGDDLVGACLFARRLCGLDAAWDAVAKNLTRAATARSNTISAALFGDLARGAAYAPLHDLAAAASARSDGGDDAALVAAAASLTAIGHSSGWDMLTGFFIGAGVLPLAGKPRQAGLSSRFPIIDGHFAVSSRFAQPAQDLTP